MSRRQQARASHCSMQFSLQRMLGRFDEPSQRTGRLHDVHEARSCCLNDRWLKHRTMAKTGQNASHLEQSAATNWAANNLLMHLMLVQQSESPEPTESPSYD